jgi:YhcN/YlaJ family sporulation lipoprotein
MNMFDCIKIEGFTENNNKFFYERMVIVKRLRLSLYIGIIMLLIAGCQNQETQQQNNMDNQRPIKVKQSYDGEKKQLSRDEISKHLVDLATRVPEVNEATAVVAGNYAVVGIDVKKDLDRSKVSSIKYSVAEALRHDPYGAMAVVTADPDIVERLKGMSDRIQDGEPLTGILDELAAIVGRIMPEVPAKIKDKSENPTEKNDQQLPKNKENQLDKEQKDQGSSNLGGNTQ